jgi:hypothetical protein
MQVASEAFECLDSEVLSIVSCSNSKLRACTNAFNGILNSTDDAS